MRTRWPLGEKEELEVKKDFTGFTLDGKTAKAYEIHNKHTVKPRKYLEAEPDYGEADEKMRVLCDKFDAFVDLYLRDVGRSTGIPEALGRSQSRSIPTREIL